MKPKLHAQCLGHIHGPEIKITFRGRINFDLNQLYVEPQFIVSQLMQFSFATQLKEDEYGEGKIPKRYNNMSKVQKEKQKRCERSKVQKERQKRCERDKVSKEGQKGCERSKDYYSWKWINQSLRKNKYCTGKMEAVQYFEFA